MKYFDLHCDTAYELFARGEKLSGNALNITADKIKSLDTYVQLAAYCAPENDSNDEAYERFFLVKDYFKEEILKNGFSLCSSFDEVARAVQNGTPSFIMTVEDARILGSSLARLETLHTAGVRVITPLWGGETVIGTSHEGKGGLTSFGKDAMHLCAELGIITDISHASEKSADDIIDIAAFHGMPVIASHSCAYGVHKHSRNIRDEHLKAVADSGGIVGVNLYPPHLTGTSASLKDAVNHISYFVHTAGEDKVALGCDFDGMGIFTQGGEDVSCIPSLKQEMLSSGMSESLCGKILFENAFRFFEKHL